ncbi:HAMP domain-containing histidine kinase, partial [Candidatus Saccharibacteria bacterium]|nr:HAMP domain-containing histidine kinase [Candidatus Saccharibacteria bacterium]
MFLSVSLAKAKTKSKVLELSVAKAQAPKIIKAPPDPAKTPAVASVPQALDISHVGIAVLDHEQKIVYHNKITPITKKMDEPEHLGLLFDPGDNVGDWLKTIDGQALRAEKAWYRVPGIPNDDGERQFYDVIATYEAGNTAETVLVIIDRSDMYSIEENDLNFIAFAAHELRGPITTIRGYLDVLEDELGSTLSPDHKELFDRMVVSSNKLASYINNILNVSNYDGQHMQLILKETTLQSIFNSIMDDVLLRAVSQGKHLYIKLGDNLPTIAADITSLGEVFINLIDNAIKYSHEDGDIEVSTDVDGDHVLVFIVDHGIGIPTSVIGNIFKKFYRSHRSR